ncbi:uncharacterized protein LOC106668311 [Cimex lectularius]|uniref:Uncharacterized protein n=1 Tax=Cimex lectularius TaxID=79782 RepID=A0A8I6S2X8_CIMLE|nr:uncharacterized protein LOC106668311 [Cimex lectularius]XP_014252422.1 uncharacterized protein LOC106668311 [Cimex lectularius]
MIGQGWTTLWVCLLVASRSFVSTAPPKESGSKNGADEEVKELEHLKNGENTMSVMKTHSLVYTNIDGKKERHEDRKAEVEKNGELVAKMEQELDKTPLSEEPHVKTMLDIPSKNIHRVFEQGSKQSPMDNGVPPYEANIGHSYSPSEMAEYIFWTGDERAPTKVIEDFLADGLMTRDEAIKFLEEVRRNLEALKLAYPDNFDQRDRQLEMFDNRQQLRDSMTKKADYQDQQIPMGEEDYEEIMERMRLTDLMYNEFSLEEIVYQLAKIMFRQALTRGSEETKEALQEFTDFLDRETKEGKISNSMQKKVLDIVITSLSDTLTRHPEFVNVAKESLRLTPPQHLNQGISEGQNGIPLNFPSDSFPLKNAVRNVGNQLEKKSD